jgi:hypothetical protein
MKKKLLVTSLAIYSLAINAQITITSTNMPMAGNSYITATDTAVVSYGSAGANQTWDFSTWANHELDTAEFKAASQLPGASFFPTATIGIGDVEGSSFMKVSSTVVETLGFFTDLGSGLAPVEFTPAQKFITLPSTYQTTYTGNYSYQFAIPFGQFGIDSLMIKSETSYTSTIDGWGSLTTPAYSSVSALRQFYTEITNDTTFALVTGTTDYVYFDNSMDTSYSYRWFSNAHTFPVIEINFGLGDTIYSGSYLTSTLVGVNELAKNTNSVSVFPSPASDKVSFKGIDSDAYLMVFDVSGKLVEQVLLKKNTTINVANYNNGVYFYNVAPLNGTPVSKGKFVVEK